MKKWRKNPIGVYLQELLLYYKYSKIDKEDLQMRFYGKIMFPIEEISLTGWIKYWRNATIDPNYVILYPKRK